MTVCVGIIANPASGRDLRRLTAQAGLHSSTDKANAVMRLLGAFGASGVQRVLMPTDMTGIAAAVLKASTSEQARAARWPALAFIDLPLTQTVADTRLAARLMAARQVSLVAVLGGDGTHKAVAAEVGETPLLTLSTGTNNAFPELREATSAGLAGGLYASGRLPAEVALRRNKRLWVTVPEQDLRECALVDVAVSPRPFIGARALLRSEDLAELFVTFAEPHAIGLSALAGLWSPVPRSAPHGTWLQLGEPAERAVVAPVAPGILQACGVRAHALLLPGQPQRLSLSHGTLALDGEREIEFSAHDTPTVALDLNGPLSIDVEAALAYAAHHRLLSQPL